MKIHLVTYATPRFEFRRKLLERSARFNRTADTVTSWTPAVLVSEGFQDMMPGISLDERGSGYWAWKPFVISAKLDAVPDGDVVFYCDVGRLYPFKLLDQPVTPYLEWMDRVRQDVMPGVLIPWDGNVGNWTKRSVLRTMAMDTPAVHSQAPVQASFSLWRASAESRAFCRQWLDLCRQRQLVSDDTDPDGPDEHPGFRAHRHDQALLTLCCLKADIQALDIGVVRPAFDSRHPSLVSRNHLRRVPGYPTPKGQMLHACSLLCATAERLVRRFVRFGKPIHE